ncbi:hypothetical protein KEM54_005170 [Ascosphaera aggregata]|nr:hypothetical protein KEM54_005170 [Ascosphaera aggregata]
MLKLSSLHTAMSPNVAATVGRMEDCALPALSFGSTSRQACQESSKDPLAGCEAGVFLVSPTNSKADFKSIQSAIDSLDDSSNATILVLSGVYNEQLQITRSAPLTILGQTDYSASQANNTVTVFNAAANVNGRYPSNSDTATFYVHPKKLIDLANMRELPVNRDVRVYNIDFHNVYAEYGVAPSLAISVRNANAGLYRVGLYSYQDTLHVGKRGNAYFYQNLIAGQTDFLYGDGTAYVQDSILSLRGCSGAITAWKGTNTTFENKYGAYISDSRVQAANTTIASEFKGECALGRPWNDIDRTIFMNTYFDATVNGGTYRAWKAWPGNTFMAVWKNFGPGYDEKVAQADELTHVLNDEQVKPYREPKDVFITEDGKSDVSWIDYDL